MHCAASIPTTNVRSMGATSTTYCYVFAKSKNARWGNLQRDACGTSPVAATRGVSSRTDSGSLTINRTCDALSSSVVKKSGNGIGTLQHLIRSSTELADMASFFSKHGRGQEYGGDWITWNGGDHNVFLRRRVGRSDWSSSSSSSAMPRHRVNGRAVNARCVSDGSSETTTTTNTAAASTTTAAIDPMDGDGDACERKRLKAELITLLSRDRKSKMSDEAMALIARLETLSPSSSPVTWLEAFNGKYVLLGSSMDNVPLLPLSLLTFNQFSIPEAPVETIATFNRADLNLRTYEIINLFEVPASRDGARPSVIGIIMAIGTLEVTSPTSFGISFNSLSIQPRHPGNKADMDTWKSLFEKDYPELGEEADGRLSRVFPEAREGWSVVLYQDEDMRISRGNRNNVYVLQKLPENDDPSASSWPLGGALNN